MHAYWAISVRRYSVVNVRSTINITLYLTSVKALQFCLFGTAAGLLDKAITIDTPRTPAVHKLSIRYKKADIMTQLVVVMTLHLTLSVKYLHLRVTGTVSSFVDVASGLGG